MQKNISVLCGWTGGHNVAHAIALLMKEKALQIAATFVVNTTDNGWATKILKDQWFFGVGDFLNVCCGVYNWIWKEYVAQNLRTRNEQWLSKWHLFFQEYWPENPQTPIIRLNSLFPQWLSVQPVSIEVANVWWVFGNQEIYWERDIIERWRTLQINLDETFVYNGVLTKKNQLAANPNILKPLEESDYIIIAPGVPRTSVEPILHFQGIKQAIDSSKAEIILILNPMNFIGQTWWRTNQHYVDFRTQTLWKEVTHVIQDTTPLPSDLVTDYAIKWFESVIIKELEPSYKIYSQPLLQDFVEEARVWHHAIKHDPVKLARVLQNICT